MASLSDNDVLRELGSRRESELRAINALRISSLESLLTERDKEIASLKSRFERVREDFNFNLKLIADRDKELDELEAKLAAANEEKTVLSKHLEECRDGIAAVTAELGAERIKVSELESLYVTQIRELEDTLSRTQNAKDSELALARQQTNLLREELNSQIGNQKKAYETKIVDLEEMLASLKRELSITIENCDIEKRRVRVLEAEIKGVTSKAREVQGELEERVRELQEREAGAKAEFSAAKNTHEMSIVEFERKLNNLRELMDKKRVEGEQYMAEAEQKALSLQLKWEASEASRSILLTTEKTLLSQIAELKKKLDYRENDVLDKQSEINLLQTTLNSKETHLSSVEQILAELRKDHDATRKKSDEYQLQVHRLKQSIDELTAKAEGLEEKAQKLQQEKEAMALEVSRLTKENASLSTPAVASALAYKESAETLLVRMSKEREELLAEISRSREYVSLLQQRSSATVAETLAADSKPNFNAMNSDNERIPHQLQSTIDGYKRECVLLRSYLDAVRSEADALRVELGRNTLELASLRGNLVALKEAHEKERKKDADKYKRLETEFLEQKEWYQRQLAMYASGPGRDDTSIPIQASASSAITALTKERDSLIELSNQLKKQVARLQSEQVTPLAVGKPMQTASQLDATTSPDNFAAAEASISPVDAYLSTPQAKDKSPTSPLLSPVAIKRILQLEAALKRVTDQNAELYQLVQSLMQSRSASSIDADTVQSLQTSKSDHTVPPTNSEEKLASGIVNIVEVSAKPVNDNTRPIATSNESSAAAVTARSARPNFGSTNVSYTKKSNVTQPVRRDSIASVRSASLHITGVVLEPDASVLSEASKPSRSARSSSNHSQRSISTSHSNNRKSISVLSASASQRKSQNLGTTRPWNQNFQSSRRVSVSTVPMVQLNDPSFGASLDPHSRASSEDKPGDPVSKYEAAATAAALSVMQGQLAQQDVRDASKLSDHPMAVAARSKQVQAGIRRLSVVNYVELKHQEGEEA